MILNKKDLGNGVFIIQHFLSNKECENFIKISEAKGYEEATVSTLEGPKMMKMIRNNQRVIEKNPELSSLLWERIKTFIPESKDFWTPISINEQFRYYKYNIGERFNKHRDGVFRRSSIEESRLTLMIYLNECFEGGETEFDTFNVKPETGTAIVFEHHLKHKGSKVLKGVKYALRSDIMFRKNNLK